MALELAVDNQSGKSVAMAKVCAVHKGMAVACCCAAMATLAPVALVQLHIIRDLPDLPGRLFDSKRVVTSKGAYHLGIPDGVLGLASYGVTLATVGRGDSRTTDGSTAVAWQAGLGCDHGDSKCSQAGDRT